MSEKQFEECSLQDATHVEMGGKVYEFGKEYVSRHKSLKSEVWDHIEVEKGTEGWQLTHVLAFPILGIKPMRERKRKPEPIEFEAVFVQHDGHWHPLYSLDDGLSYLHCKKARFRCIQILEDEK